MFTLKEIELSLGYLFKYYKINDIKNNYMEFIEQIYCDDTLDNLFIDNYLCKMFIPRLSFLSVGGGKIYK